MLPEGVFCFVGFDPDSEVLGGPVDVDAAGFVLATKFETSMEGGFAAGDVREGSHKQLADAVGEGVGALLIIRAYLRQHEHGAAEADEVA